MHFNMISIDICQCHPLLEKKKRYIDGPLPNVSLTFLKAIQIYRKYYFDFKVIIRSRKIREKYWKQIKPK